MRKHTVVKYLLVRGVVSKPITEYCVRFQQGFAQSDPESPGMIRQTIREVMQGGVA